MTKTYTLKELEPKPGDKIGWITSPKSVRWIVDNCGNLVGVTTKEPLSSAYYEGGPEENCCKFVLISRAEPEYKTWGNMSDEEKGALLLAHHEGKTIEFLINSNYNTWGVPAYNQPSWCDDDTYRIKPEPMVKKREVFIGPSGVYPHENYDDTHKITFDVVDGEPDCNSIRMEKL